MGSFPITVQATDTDTPMNKASASLTLVVNSGPLVITTMSLPAGTATGSLQRHLGSRGRNAAVHVVDRIGAVAQRLES